MADTDTDQRKKAVFVLALPYVHLRNIPQYDHLNKIGTVVATTEAGAVSTYVFRLVTNKLIAKTIVDQLKQPSKLEDFAMRLPHPEEYLFEDGTKMNVSEINTAREIEVCNFLAGQYGGNPIDYLTNAREILRRVNPIRIN